MTDSLSRNIFMSVAGHIAVVLVIFFQAVLIPHDPIDLRRAIRVDVVGLPEKMSETQLKPKAEAPAPEVKEAKKPKPLPEKAAAEPPKPEAPVMPNPKAKNIKKSQEQALNQIKSLQALEKIKGQLKAEKEKSEASTVVKGNQVNAGNSLTGLEKIEFDRYFDDLEEKIRARWSIPQWLADAKLKAQVKVLIDDRGFVTAKNIIKSSGNPVFDDSVIAAVEESSPLPPPPKRLTGLLKTRGIIFNFPE